MAAKKTQKTVDRSLSTTPQAAAVAPTAQDRPRGDSFGAGADTASTAGAFVQQSDQIARLEKLTARLGETIAALHEKQERKASFEKAIDAVERAATSVSTMPARGSIERPSTSPTGQGCDETCPECQCVGPNCCCFNIMLNRVRVTSLGGIIGLVDEGGLALELQIYAYIAGIGGVLYPSLGGHVMVQGKLGGPGAWASANILIIRVCIPKGQTKTFDLITEVKENDKIFKDDIGSASVSIMLNCCCSDVNLIAHEVQLVQGGGGKAVIGMEIRVAKVC